MKEKRGLQINEDMLRNQILSSCNAVNIVDL